MEDNWLQDAASSIEGDWLDAAAKEVQQPVLRKSIEHGIKKSPKDFIETSKAAKKLNVPIDLVERNPEEIQSTIKSQDIYEKLNQTEIVKKAFEDPDFASVAHNDVDILTKLERTLKAAGAGVSLATLGMSESILRTPQAVNRGVDYLNQIGRNLGLPEWMLTPIMTNPLDIIERGVRIGETQVIAGTSDAADKINDSIKILSSGDISESFKRISEKGHLANSAFDKALGGDFEALADVITDPESWAGFIGQAAPSLYTAYKSGGSVPFIAWLEGMEVANDAADLERITGQKIDPALFTQATAQAAAINSILEKFGLDKVFGGNGTLSSIIKGAVVEGGTEGLQQLNTNVAEILTFDPSKSMTEGVLGSIMGGAGSGGLMGGASSIARAANAEFSQNVIKANKSIADAQLLNEVVDLSKNAELKKIAPEVYDKFLTEVLGADSNVFIDPDSAKAFFQSHPEILDTLPKESAKAINESLSTDGDVVIPKSEYLTYLTDYHEELSPILRNDQDGMSLKEIEEWEKTAKDNLYKEYEKIKTGQDQVDAFNQSAEKVFQNVKGQLVKTGRFNEGVAEKYALLHKAFAQTMAGKLNLTPEQVYDKLGLKIQGTPIIGETLSQPEIKKDDIQKRIKPQKERRILREEPTQEQRSKERRQDIARREKISQMTPEEQYKAIYTNELTGLNNRRAFEEDLPEASVVVSIDVDALKSVNDHLGQDAGDQLLKVVANELHETTDNSAYHISGDEFYLLGENKEQLIQQAEQALSNLKGKAISSNKGTLDGIGFSYGVASNKNEADSNMKEHKKEREKRGERTSRGEMPKNLILPGQEKQMPLFQQQRGSFQPDTNLIALLETADLSTFLHESGHFFLEAMNSMPELNQDMDVIFEWFGTDRGTWNQMSLEERRDNHEKFARGFESYLMEGKSPSLELQSVFQRFRDWLISIYKSFKNLNVELTPEVRQVFDRMLATDEQIREAEAARAYTPLFESIEDSGMTDKQWQDYQKLDQDRRTQSREELQTRSLQDMKWMSNAKSKVLRDIQKDVANKRKTIRDEVSREVSRETVYQAIRFFRRGEIEREGGIAKVEPHRLDIDGLNAIFPYGEEFDIPDWRSLGHGKYGMLARNGLDPEDAAHMFNYPSADQMIRDMLEAPPKKEYIDAITDQRMMEAYGDITNPIAMERAAEEAIHNDVHTRFIHTELKALTKGEGKKNVLAKAAKQFATDAINKKKIKDIKPGQYLSSQTRAGNNALKALAKGDRESAVDHKRAQVLNNHFYRVATQASKDIDKMLRYVKKFTKEGTRKNLDPEYLEQIDDLLGSFEIKNVSLKKLEKRQLLSDFIKQQEEEGFQPAIDEALINETKRKNYKLMTFEEFRGHVETIKHIEHLGRLKKRLLTAKDKREFNARMGEARLSIELNKNRKVKEAGTPTDTASKLSVGFKQFAAIHRKAASIVREMDGGRDNGVMWNLFVRSVNEAGDKSVEMKAEASEQLGKLFDQIKIRSGVNNIRAPKYVVPGTNISMTDEQRLMFALNWGNEGNRQRLLDGGLAGKRQLTSQDAQAILDTLSKQELGFVQGVFDFIETYKDQIGEQEKRLTGKTPEWIEPTEIKTRNGAIKGGYFPAKYDTVLSTRSESLEAVTNLRLGMKGAFNAAATRSGYTKERANEVKGRPLLLSFGVINQHVNEVIHRLSYQDWVTDANRILNALDPTIREYYGPEILKELRNTVKDVAEGDKGAANIFESMANHARVGATIVGMGFRITTAAIQPTGFAQSIYRIGAGSMGKGLKEFITSPAKSYKDVMEKSAFMRDRNRTLQREVNEVLNKVRGKDKIGFFKQNAFWLIAKTQMAVDTPTWLGAYDKALIDLKLENAKDQTERNSIEETAIQLANQAVRDSQSAGLIFDQAGIQRGSPLLRLFTNFYSYFSATYNLNVEAYRKANLKSPKGLLEFTGDMVVLNFVPTVMSVLIYEAVRGDCGGDMECLGRKYTDEQINFLMGQMVGVRELSGAATALSGGKSYGYQGAAGMRVLSEIQKAGQQASQGEFDEAARRSLLNVTGMILHLPLGQVNTMLDGITAVENGETEGARSVLAPLVGPPRE